MELNKILSQEEFFVGDGNLSDYYKKLTKLNFGALMYCESGEAIITIDLNEYRVVQNTNIFLIPNSIFSIDHATPDFKINYFIYSIEMFHTASFRLEPAFIHFIYENPCYTHSDQVKIKSLQNLIKACANIYHDKDNRFRNDIAQNLLQIFFFDTYDKVQRLFTDRKPFTSNRKEEIFKRFLDLIHVHCVKQRDVAWYAAELCISTRYLASIVRDISGEGTAKDIIDCFCVLELKVALQTTSLSIKEIADKYNFPDQSFLGRFFKKHTGMSPSEYRQLK